ncbi:MAG TPA: hypothetical protein VFF67_05560 [Thermoplasmata archaeon]|nr:hypothetical protein [Thermoplasmata archaeon]
MRTGSGGATVHESRTAIVVAGEEETRVLLRGLLRLHHVRVVGEAAGATQGAELLAAYHPKVLVADATLTEGDCGSLVETARRSEPSTWIVVITPDRRRPVPALGTTPPDAILTRPFRIQEFADVLSTGAGAAAAAATP